MPFRGSVIGPGARRLLLTTHVVSSVGWLGAVLGFLALSAAGIRSVSSDTVRSMYIAMNLLGQLVIVPLSIVALVTGSVQALATHWGIARYYWVFTKFVLTIVATALLLLHQFTAVSDAATRALAAAPGRLPDLGGLPTQLVVDAAAAIILLLVTTALSVYKPWGMIAWAMPIASDASGAVGRTPVGFRAFALIVAVFVARILAIHIAGGGMHHHH
jgi:hypothetical protein